MTHQRTRLVSKPLWILLRPAWKPSEGSHISPLLPGRDGDARDDGRPEAQPWRLATVGSPIRDGRKELY